MSFVEDYVTLAKERVPEAPEMFHEAIALFVLSVAAGPNVKLQMSYGEVYPNIWVLLLGESNITHKTTSMKLALDLLMSVCPELDMSGEFNPEGLISELAERTADNNCRGMLHRDEFGGFVASLSREYMAGTKDIIMNTYDVPRVYTRRLVKNTYVIRYPYLPFLTATTPSRAQQVFNETDTEDGFLGRFVIINADGHNPDFIPVSLASPMMAVKHNSLAKTLRKIYEDFVINEARYTMDDEALKMYNDWLQKLRERKDLPGVMVARVPTFVLKLAMLYDISERPFFVTKEPKLEPYEIEKAIRFVECVFLPSAEAVFNTILGDKLTEKIYEIIKKAGEDGIQRAKLLRTSHTSSGKLSECIRTLLESNRVKKREIGKAEIYVINEEKVRAHLPGMYTP